MKDQDPPLSHEANCEGFEDYARGYKLSRPKGLYHTGRGCHRGRLRAGIGRHAEAYC